MNGDLPWVSAQTERGKVLPKLMVGGLLASLLGAGMLLGAPGLGARTLLGAQKPKHIRSTWPGKCHRHRSTFYNTEMGFSFSRCTAQKTLSYYHYDGAVTKETQV